MTLVHRSWRLVLVVGMLAAGAVIAAPAAAQGGAVSIVGLSFQPATITVAVGDTVTWTTTESVGAQHSVTSGKPGGSDVGKEFDSGFGLQNNGDTYTFTFTQAGTFDYFCEVHPTQMTGQVIVTAAGGSLPPAGSEAPAASQTPTPVGTGTPGNGASGAPGPVASGVPAPGESTEAGIAPERKLITAAILIVALVLLFGATWLWRRMNPA